MRRRSIFITISHLKKSVFSTFELASLSGKSLSVTTQALNNLVKDGLVEKIYRGIWAKTKDERVSPYLLIPYLFTKSRAYVSFVSALHLYGIIEQIPQVIYLASLSHTKVIRTKIGVFSVHQITPSLFDGFKWYRETGDFLIAEQEKALVDSLYLSGYKKKQFGSFPELNFPRSFSFKKANEWVKKIPNLKIKTHVQQKLNTLSKISVK
jgi:predicted transcriptional regulator of viral defense system